MHIARETTDVMRALLHDAEAHQFCLTLLGVITGKRTALTEELANLNPTDYNFVLYYAIIQSRLETFSSIGAMLTAQLPPVSVVVHNNVIKL